MYKEQKNFTRFLFFHFGHFLESHTKIRMTRMNSMLITTLGEKNRHF